MTTETYVVVKEGVYIQGVFGPYPSPDEADAAARRLAKEEPDDWHTFFAAVLPVDGAYPQGSARGPLYRGERRV